MIQKNKKYVLPGFFTCLNFCGGFLAVIQCLQGRYTLAAWLIIAAVVCDAFDGLIARRTDSASSFGFQLDSLADLVTSGVAPAVFVYAVYPEPGPAITLAALFFALSAAYRLARYNAEPAVSAPFYKGLPAPVAAATVVSYWLFRFRPAGVHQIWLILLIIFGILMLSQLPYRWPVLRFGNFRDTSVSAGKLLLTGLMVCMPGTFIFPLFLLYSFRGIAVNRNRS